MSAKPTKKQVVFLKQLCRELDHKYVEPSTGLEASDQIAFLAAKRSSRTDPPTGKQMRDLSRLASLTGHTFEYPTSGYDASQSIIRLQGIWTRARRHHRRKH